MVTPVFYIVCLISWYKKLISGVDIQQWEYYLNTKFLKTDGPNYLLKTTDFNPTQIVHLFL